MRNALAIDPLDRTCTELTQHTKSSKADLNDKPDTKVTVRQLKDIPLFVLLGDPGMGKTQTMKVLANSTNGSYIKADTFIVSNLPCKDKDQHLLIDALDEARATGDGTVWRNLRTKLALCNPRQLGIACRAADWFATDKEELTVATHGRAIRVFTLDPLTTAQTRLLLEHDGHQDIEAFESQAEALGFADMLGNPQSLKLLTAAAKQRGGRLPDTRREAYELACKELAKEKNPHHYQQSGLVNHEHLLDAAGWLCALLLLSNRSSVITADPEDLSSDCVGLGEVLDAFPNKWATPAIFHTVLHRPLFIKTHGYMPVHRTVAEYLAARHIAQRITHGGLLPNRVAALMLASGTHVVSNLRGLAGWMAALCTPMRSIILAADPMAVLSYGDLSLLSTSDKCALIDALTTQPTTPREEGLWQQAAVHAPLVHGDMLDFVSVWLGSFRTTESPTPAHSLTAHVFLNALQEVPADHLWEPALLKLVRAENLPIGIRSSALDALHVHRSSPDTLLALLEDLHQDKLAEATGRLADELLQMLYPSDLTPHKVLRFLSKGTAKRHGYLGFSSFWRYHIQRQTNDQQLPALLNALEMAIEQDSLIERVEQIDGQYLEGLGELVVRGICLLGKDMPTSQLARWIWLCGDLHESPLRLNQTSAQRLGQWVQQHTDITRQVVAMWLADGKNTWEIQNKLPTDWLPQGMGKFWFQQAQSSLQRQAVNKASECLKEAIRCLDHANSELSLDDIVAAAEADMGFMEILTPLLKSDLENNNQRQRWLDNEKRRSQSAATEAQHEKSLGHLLDHLDEVRSGKAWRYLHEAACVQATYGGSHNGHLIEQWRKECAELDLATHEGHLTLLLSLNERQATQSVKNQGSNTMWPYEVPCLVAAQRLYEQEPQRFLELGQERLQALVTLFLLHHTSDKQWFMALVDQHPDWVEYAWWSVSAKALRSKTLIRIPYLGLLAREESARPLAARLLPRFLSAWPAKFSEANHAEFVYLLEATINVCPATVVSEVIARRLDRKSIGTLQRSHLLMAGLWIDPPTFAPMLDVLVSKRQIVQSELLGFIAHLGRHNGPPTLPSWDINTMSTLFKLFAPLCPSAHPTGSYVENAKDAGRAFLYQLLTEFRNDTTEPARLALQSLADTPLLADWTTPLADTRARQANARAEHAFSMPNPRQVAMTMLNSTPANPNDLLAVALDALKSLQHEIHNSSTNLRNDFWNVDPSGKRPIPEHRPEPQCRNVIARFLMSHLGKMGITVNPENQHGGQNQSDIALSVHSVGNTQMVLPIEVKGDWHQDLRTAPIEQLAMKYASDARCHGKGLYLVLWLGTHRGKAARPKQHPNQPTSDPVEFQRILQDDTNRLSKSMDIRIFVLDVSIDRTQA